MAYEAALEPTEPESENAEEGVLSVANKMRIRECDCLFRIIVYFSYAVGNAINVCQHAFEQHSTNLGPKCLRPKMER